MPIPVIILIVVVLILALLGLAMWWYLRRAKRIGETNGLRRSPMSELLLDLQDIRDSSEGDLATILDEIIDIARYDTPAGNEQTADLDEAIVLQLNQFKKSPTVEQAHEIKNLLIARNRRVIR